MSNSRTTNPRPRLGPRLVRGLALWADTLDHWYRAGFVPADWTKAEEREAAAAADYLGRLVTWYRRLVADRRKGKN